MTLASFTIIMLGNPPIVGSNAPGFTPGVRPCVRLNPAAAARIQASLAINFKPMQCHAPLYMAENFLRSARSMAPFAPFSFGDLGGRPCLNNFAAGWHL